MQKLRPLVAFILIAIIFAGGLWLGFKMPRWLGMGSTQRVLGTATVLQQVQTLSELITVKYVMEKVVIFEDVKWYPGGDNRVLLVAHGIVKAGVDLKQLEPGDVSVNGKTLSLRLPPARITDAYLDEKETRVIERTTGLLRLFDKDLEQTARQIAVSDIHRAARNAGILKDAEDRAREQLRVLFLQSGFEQVEFRTK
jgi:hypothetical protein